MQTPARDRPTVTVRDVVESLRELGPTVVGHPGGDLVSGHRWEGRVDTEVADGRIRPVLPPVSRATIVLHGGAP